MAPLVLAYYCSGHGYGHATRVDAFASHLLNNHEKPTIFLVSSAPEHVFVDSISKGAVYRYAEIDPVIVQPVAYRVDRQKSVDALRKFIQKKDTFLLEAERLWLQQNQVSCVLSDAAFLGCLAAKAAGIPSILITNFTFDSVYSFLSTTTVLEPEQLVEQLAPDLPVPAEELALLVHHIHAGYRCADRLMLLPGNIPIPSFTLIPSLPAPAWIDSHNNTFRTDIVERLFHPGTPQDLLPPVPFPNLKHIPRQVIAAPLIVRSPTPSVYQEDGRSRLLSSIGIPVQFHDTSRTKILIVSFGGQVFRKPTTRSGSRTPVKRNSRELNPVSSGGLFKLTNTLQGSGSLPDLKKDRVFLDISTRSRANTVAPRLATASHIWIPGAPPVVKRLGSPTTSPIVPKFTTTPPTPDEAAMAAYFDEEPRLLPDSSWIAIVCGVSKEQWNSEDNSELPEGFFVAPRDVYMPDLTAAGDVLLGKLGYGTVSECVDSCTPFVYVSRPLFIEEHGLRLLLSREGTGVELSRESYEDGDWAAAVQEAWVKGSEAKTLKRAHGKKGIGMNQRKLEGQAMAGSVLSWIKDFSGA
ncbi:hypothetical protein C8J56DRAFT_780240 [Mycena floridula]|nr:hypothetical protein C8J56DRAFT_780240 [Mycena floridula]